MEKSIFVIYSGYYCDYNDYTGVPLMQIFKTAWMCFSLRIGENTDVRHRNRSVFFHQYINEPTRRFFLRWFLT